MNILYSLIKIAGCYLKNNKVRNTDYRDEYNKILSTYQIWNRKMLPSPQTILRFDLLLQQKGKIHILDFGCGMGYIINQMLTFFKKNKFKNFSITGVDISDQFINYCKKQYPGNNLKFVESDGLDYLHSISPGMFHAIYCNWTLPYFDRRILLPAFNKVCRNNGILGIVSNCKGTLKNIESSYLEVMLENPDSFKKVMDITSHLPAGRKGLNRWMRACGFLPLFSGEKNVEFSFPTPVQLYTWLNKSGALAGTKQIFYNFESVENKIINKIAKKNKVRRAGEDMYLINHKFVFGIYRKQGRG